MFRRKLEVGFWSGEVNLEVEKFWKHGHSHTLGSPVVIWQVSLNWSSAMQHLQPHSAWNWDRILSKMVLLWLTVCFMLYFYPNPNSSKAIDSNKDICGIKLIVICVLRVYKWHIVWFKMLLSKQWEFIFPCCTEQQQQQWFPVIILVSS